MVFVLACFTESHITLFVLRLTQGCS